MIIALLLQNTLKFKAMKIPKISKQYIRSTSINAWHMAAIKSPSGNHPKDKGNVLILVAMSHDREKFNSSCPLLKNGPDLF